MDRLRGRVQAMTSAADVKNWAAAVFQGCGLRGRGSIWRLRGSEVQWVIHIDQLPFGERLGVDVGLDLQTDSTPRRPTDCGILLHLENLPFATDLWVARAMDLGSDLDEEHCRQDVDNALRALGEYIAARGTLDEVRSSYRKGDFRSGLIRKDARELLYGRP